MDAVFAKIAEETTNFGLGDEEVSTRFINLKWTPIAYC